MWLHASAKEKTVGDIFKCNYTLCFVEERQVHPDDDEGPSPSPPLPTVTVLLAAAAAAAAAFEVACRRADEAARMSGLLVCPPPPLCTIWIICPGCTPATATVCCGLAAAAAAVAAVAETGVMVRPLCC